MLKGVRKFYKLEFGIVTFGIHFHFECQPAKWTAVIQERGRGRVGGYSTMTLGGQPMYSTHAIFSDVYNYCTRLFLILISHYNV